MYNKFVIKKVLIVFIFLIVIVFLGFLYFTRPVVEPSLDVSKIKNDIVTKDDDKVFKIVF